ncbi:5585_t:CDS:1, partial [Funneliformis caledonium]
MRSIKRFCDRLPLMTIKSHNVKLSSKDIPSTSKKSKETYFFSVTDHIKRILSNLKIRNCLYFSEGIETDTKSEFWYEELWQQSPLFRAECYHHNN